MARQIHEVRFDDPTQPTRPTTLIERDETWWPEVDEMFCYSGSPRCEGHNHRWRTLVDSGRRD